MIEFPHDYFEDEVRDGFYVNGLMKKCWAAQLEVLSDIAAVCEKYNIKWYADCGTLLGAVRHGGFIPWDDDMDICMFREDYEKFFKVAAKELKSIYSNYVLYDYHSDNYDEMIGRVDNAVGWELSDEHLAKFHGYPFRAGVDIFPLDYLCDNRAEEEDRMLVAQMIFTVARREDLTTLNDEVVEYLDSIEEACNIHFDRHNNLKIQLFELGEKLFSLYKRKEATKAVLMIYWLYNESHVYPLELYEKTVMLPFETIKIPVPAMYNEVLKIEYGDYMRIVRTGSAHEYPYHEKYIKAINDDMGEKSPFNKRVSREDVNSQIKCVSGDTPRKELAGQIKGSLQLFEEAHLELVKMASAGQAVDVINMLEQCQEFAIQTGTLIEESYGEGTNTVKSLEDYCELVYIYHEQIAGGEKLFNKEEYNNDEEIDNTDVYTDYINELYSDLNEQLVIISSRMNEEIVPRKEIVFFPYKSSKWMYMEPEWRRACSLPDTDVYVVPIPYYHKNCLGAIESEHYDVEGYPDYVNVIDYNSYDYEVRQPDKIYIQVPYDDDNYSITINPYFYTKNLKKYTDELVYVPCFVQEEFDESDERAYKSMKYYAVSSGVVYADKVYVQSEHMKGMYIKKLVEFFGEDSKNIWESKLEARPEDYDIVNMRLSKNNIDMPETWKNIIYKSDGSTKKVIMYYIGVDGLMEHGEKMLEKIRASLDIFKGNVDNIALILRGDPLIKETVAVNDSKLYLKYSAMIDKYKTDGYGIYYDGNDTGTLIQIIDAYYGDVDKMIQQCRSRKIPVMIQNVDV